MKSRVSQWATAFALWALFRHRAQEQAAVRSREGHYILGVLRPIHTTASNLGLSEIVLRRRKEKGAGQGFNRERWATRSNFQARTRIVLSRDAGEPQPLAVETVRVSLCCFVLDLCERCPFGTLKLEIPGRELNVVPPIEFIDLRWIDSE